MSRQKFRDINRFLHFNDNEGDTGTDPLYTLRVVIEDLMKKFKESYQLGQKIVIDERTLAWKGHFFCRFIIG